MTKSTLLEKLSNSSTLEHSNILSESKFFGKEEQIPTPVPIINVALSSRVDGGLVPGSTVVAGESKNFKTNLGLAMMAAYQKKYPDAVCLYYDSEFGSPPGYLSQFGIDTDRIIHCPITDLEYLRHDLTNQLNNIEIDDNVFVFVDSLGNLPSKKEVDDAESGNQAADMTRARVIKSLFRIVTPMLTMKSVPMVTINHTYKTMELFSKDVVGGGTGPILSSDTVFIISRRQDKDQTTKELHGFEFDIKIEKSRFVKEQSKLTFTASFENGIDKWSGLLDVALKTGHVEKPKKGWYTRPSVENDKNWRRAETSCKDFWSPILKTTNFTDAIHRMYAIGEVDMLDSSDDDDDDPEENDSKEAEEDNAT